MKINYDKIKEYNDELESFDGYLPYIILMNVDYKKYFDNLKEYDDYDDVNKEFYQFRIEHKKHKGDEKSFFEKDLVNWCNTHKEYEDIING